MCPRVACYAFCGFHIFCAFSSFGGLFFAFSFYFMAFALQLWQLLIKICKKRSVSVALLCFGFSTLGWVLFHSRKLISALFFWSVRSEKNDDVIKEGNKSETFSLVASN